MSKFFNDWFLMWMKYYRGGKHTKDIAYFSALTLIEMQLLFFMGDLQVFFGFDFTGTYGSLNRSETGFKFFLYYFIPFTILLYFLFPPKKMLRLYRHYKPNRAMNILYVSILVVSFLIILIFVPNGPYDKLMGR